MNKTDKIKELENKITELTGGWQRTQADFINYKNNQAKERSALIKSANTDLICEILPILDNFALAAKHIPKELEDNAWASGVKQIEKQLETVLLNWDLTKIDSIGALFDPEKHESVGEIESEKPEGEIIEEIAAGYVFNDCVIRPAKVKIAKKKS